MRLSSLIAALSLLTGGAQAPQGGTNASSVKPAPQGERRPFTLVPPGKSLYSGVFQVPAPAPEAHAAIEAIDPTIVCGMLLIPANPRVNSAQVVRPSDVTVDFKIRALVPQVCHK
jgi:hypothetical protein